MSLISVYVVIICPLYALRRGCRRFFFSAGSSSLAALEIVNLTTSGAAGRGGFVGMMTFPPQCTCIPYRCSQSNFHVISRGDLGEISGYACSKEYFVC